VRTDFCEIGDCVVGRGSEGMHVAHIISDKAIDFVNSGIVNVIGDYKSSHGKTVIFSAL
jgi:hypothetical protein